MKILLIGPFPPPIDGCSNANKVLYENLKIRNFKCTTINTNTNIITSEQGSRFSIKKAFLFIKNYFELYKILLCNVVYFTPGQTFYGVLKYFPFIVLCLLMKKPYTIHVHGNYLGKQYEILSGVKRKIFHFLISNASAGIVITKSLSKNFSNLLPEKKIFIVEYFIEESLFKGSLVKKTDKLRIIYLSNLMIEKGILEVLDALLELSKESIRYEATIAGSLQNGIQKEVDKRLELLSTKVNYIGVITGETKLEMLTRANVFILPTYYKMEGLPFSLLEAMATGNIIITTAHAGISDVMNSSNGFLIKPKSSQAIVECLKEIDNDIPGMINKHSNFNRLYSQANFTEENYTNKILSILHATTIA